MLELIPSGIKPEYIEEIDIADQETLLAKYASRIPVLQKIASGTASDIHSRSIFP